MARRLLTQLLTINYSKKLFRRSRVIENGEDSACGTSGASGISGTSGTGI